MWYFIDSLNVYDLIFVCLFRKIELLYLVVLWEKKEYLFRIVFRIRCLLERDIGVRIDIFLSEYSGKGLLESIIYKI